MFEANHSGTLVYHASLFSLVHKPKLPPFLQSFKKCANRLRPEELHIEFGPWLLPSLDPFQIASIAVPMLILQTQSTKMKLNLVGPYHSFLSFSLLLILTCPMIKKKQKRPSNLLSDGFQRARSNWIPTNGMGCGVHNGMWWVVQHPLCEHPPDWTIFVLASSKIL